MDNKLVVSNGNLESFISSLNNATGFNSGLVVMPHIKYNAEKGLFERETKEVDAENKPVYEEIGDSVEFHIITTRKMVVTDRKAKIQLYSREFQDSYVELYDQDKKVVMKGLYKDLKEANEHLVFVQVLYVIMENKPYRLKMSGSKLTALFPYLASFKNDSPVRYLTKAKKGNQVINGGVKYYELVLERGDEILDQQLIVDRVNNVNFYIEQMSKIRKDNSVAESERVPVEAFGEPLPGEHEMIEGEEIKIENIPL